MTYVDMKYTSLFWKLGFVEETTDIYIKNYTTSYHIDIQAEKQEIIYGENLNSDIDPPMTLYEHKDFVVLECVNILLKKGYARKNLHIIGDVESNEMPDIIVYNDLGEGLYAIQCKRWGKDFEEDLDFFKKGKGGLFSYFKKNKNIRYLCLYTSRLDGGLLEYKNTIIMTSSIYNNMTFFHLGIFEGNIKPYNLEISLSDKEKQIFFEKVNAEANKIDDIQDFLIEEGVLIKYIGESENIIIPSNVQSIGIGAFWNCMSLFSVVIPNGVERIGGDAFYYCKNLENINIPNSVELIGNDPFAGCPLLTVNNNSPNFILEDGVLYDKKRTTIIHYPINKRSKTFDIPDGVKFIGKHAFYDCSNLNYITIPKSVICIENNVFAGCKRLIVINLSPYLVIENGVLYNNEITQLFSLFDYNLETLIIPDSVRTIGKNAFWNCRNLKSLVIPKSVTRIGYNPFGGCNSLVIENLSPFFKIENGVLINKEKSELIYCPNTSISETFTIPESVISIGSNSFTSCVNLKKLVIPSNITIIERGTFSGCINLSSIKIPHTVKFIGKWAFGHCKSLKTVEISRNTLIEDFAFAECPAKIIVVS